MKISLKIPRKHIIEVHRLLNNVEYTGILSKEEKRDKSIFSSIFLKIAKKSLECQVSPSDKPLRMEVQYHEAYELERKLRELQHKTEPNSYERNAVRMLIDNLNKNLA